MVDPFDRFAGVRDEFQIGNTLPDGDVELVGTNEAREILTGLLPLFCFAQ